MKMRLSIWLMCCFILSQTIVAENFIVNKRRPQSQSMSKLKENYADELAGLVSMIPEMQKQLADLQQRLINELYALLDNDINIGKIEFGSRICKAQELRCFLENEYENSLPAKSSFIQKNKKEVCISQATKEAQAR